MSEEHCMCWQTTNKFEQNEVHIRPTQNCSNKHKAQYEFLGPLGVKGWVHAVVRAKASLSPH